MGDSTLDDFFAKKDRSKKKTRKKDALAEIDLSSLGLDIGKKETKKEAERGGGGDVLVQLTSIQQPDEEWNDFEEAKEVDYSGLKIQIFNTLKDNPERDRPEDEGGFCDEDNKDCRDGTSGPWNQQGGQAAPAVPAQAVPSKEEVKDEPAPKAAGKYIPPSQRQGAAGANSASKLPGSRKSKATPNVNSEEDFPVLGGKGVSGSGTWAGASQYSNAATSDLVDNPNQRRSANLNLENKFSALQD